MRGSLRWRPPPKSSRWGRCAVPVMLFRIKDPVTALSFEEGREVPHTVPPGACIAVENSAFDVCGAARKKLRGPSISPSFLW